MDNRKQAVCAALYRWISQRPGLEFGNYGDITSYRAEVRSIGRDLHDARTLLRQVELSDSITADDLIAAAKHAYNGTGSRARVFRGETVLYDDALATLPHLG